MGQITVTVNLDDLYTEEEGTNFSEVIKDNIAYEVKRMTYEQFKKDVLPSFEAQVKRKIELDKDLKIKDLLDELFRKPELKKNHYNNDKVSVVEYVENYFRDFSIGSVDFKRSVEGMIKKQSQEIAQQLKDRYDLLFASQIVTKLNEQGMLKEDVAKILLGNS